MEQLQEYALVARIVSGISTVVLLAVSASVTVLLYRWHRESSKMESSRKMNEELKTYTQMVLESEDLQELEIKSHRWGKLDKNDVKKMYRYFILFNIAYSCLEARNVNAISKPLYEIKMDHWANVTFDEKGFIKQHVFPRGYGNDLRKEFVKRWKTIDDSGTLRNH